MNAKEKGGSSYLCAKVTNARNSLLGEPVPEAAAEPPKPDTKQEPPKKEE
jgi:hypothetical protein